ncbi:MAG: triosephosphate isomerase (TIM) [Candidatus Berkelbacteria bacterium Licking1014_85]|uniref:Triosephosphate isomerase n=1 Tax=Candidatus Berkelbacteria bacterium Licking1014_85 TaxID=2017148 RepID=A0A554LJ95_9BACT|nr:MAG: triosephosphate isomerase (TIM) [Candidatus Berkelbacteria bacterium Licking1014_85]
MLSKHPLIVGNWKMNTSLADAEILAETMRNGLENISHVDVVLAPPFVWLYPVKVILSKACPKNLMLGAQNMHFENDGAFTGEISASMLKNLVEFVILGHSERVKYFHEDENITRKKVLKALEVGLHPIVCVGETSKSATAASFVSQKAERIVSHLKKSELEHIAIAYEPVWAIGTGKNADSDYAADVCRKIKDRVGNDVKVLYGGSVNADNSEEYLIHNSINGLLVGGSSLKASEFLKICEQASGTN